MLETGLLALLNKSAKEYWATIKAKEHAKATAKVKKEEKLKVKRSVKRSSDSAGDRRRAPRIPEGSEANEVQEQMLLRDQVIDYLQSRVVLLEQKLVTHGIPLPEEKRHVLPFDQVFQAEWEEQLQELRFDLNQKKEEIFKVSQENEDLKSQLQLASTEASTANSKIEQLLEDEKKRSKKEAKKRKRKNERKAAKKAKKENEEKEAKEAKQVEFLQGEWEHSKHGIGIFKVHGKRVSFKDGHKMQIEVKDDGQITMCDWQLYQAKPQAIWWKRIGDPEKNIFWVKGEWLDQAKGDDHRVWLQNRKGRSNLFRRLWDTMDTSSYDLPFQVLDEKIFMEVTRAVRKIVVKPADTPQRSPQADVCRQAQPATHSPATAACLSGAGASPTCCVVGNAG